MPQYLVTYRIPDAPDRFEDRTEVFTAAHLADLMDEIRGRLEVWGKDIVVSYVYTEPKAPRSGRRRHRRTDEGNSGASDSGPGPLG